MSETSSKPSNAKQASQYNPYMSFASQEQPTLLATHLTHEKSSWFQHTAFSKYSHVLQHINNQYILPLKRTHKLQALPSQEEMDADYRKAFSITILFLNHTNCFVHLKGAFTISEGKKTLIISKIWTIIHQSCLHTGHVIFSCMTLLESL